MGERERGELGGRNVDFWDDLGDRGSLANGRTVKRLFLTESVVFRKLKGDRLIDYTLYSICIFL